MDRGPISPIEIEAEGLAIKVIDQTRLPHRLEEVRLDTPEATEEAIRQMIIRGAPLIGAVAAWGLVFALKETPHDLHLNTWVDRLKASRPTAVNLAWALERMRRALMHVAPLERLDRAIQEARAICEEDIAQNFMIGEHGLKLLEELYERRQRPIQILTHCNAGALATVAWGTALAPLYRAKQRNLPIHVWVDETRPRNQGALTAWELQRADIPCHLIVDNAGGHLMQHGEVDIVIVGADRVSRRGDVCNKIGTYLKALAAEHNGIPFYAAVPTPTIDRTIDDALKEIPIEERSGREVSHLMGLDESRALTNVSLVSHGVETHNPAFDVTPADLMTGIITEKGIVPATHEGIASLFS